MISMIRIVCPAVKANGCNISQASHLSKSVLKQFDLAKSISHKVITIKTQALTIHD